jgi:hypothetical protein
LRKRTHAEALEIIRRRRKREAKPTWTELLSLPQVNCSVLVFQPYICITTKLKESNSTGPIK